MHFYRNLKLRGKLMFIICSISFLFVIPYIVVFTMLRMAEEHPENLQFIVGMVAPIVLGCLAVIWLIAIFLALRFSKRITLPIQKIGAAADEITKGSLNVRVDYESKDELGDLARDINSLSQNLTAAVKEIIFLLESLAHGDFTVESHIAWPGDWAKISVAFKEILNSLNRTFLKVSVASDQTSSGSEQVSGGAQALAQGATEQASAIEQLSATILEVSEHVKKNASNAAEANRSSSEEKQKLQDASAQMDDMMKAMMEIVDTSQQISNIIKAIDDISFQTNILSLNAAVEAARAGAAGKGFAVVADEVRNLASKSAEAAKNTTSLIENSIKAVRNGRKVAETTEQTLLEVIKSAGHTNELVNEIANASNQQATSINQITQGVQQISAVVQTNSATAEESAAASAELANQAKELKRSVSSLKLKGQAAAPAQKASAPKQAETKPANAKAEEKPAARAAEPAAAAAFAPGKTGDKYV